MQVPHFIKKIPNQIEYGCMLFITKGAEAKHRIDNFAQTKFNQFIQTDFCKQNLTPFYERHFSYLTFPPLTNDDYVFIKRSLMGALLLNIIAVKTLGIGMLPLAATAGILLMQGVYYIMLEKVHKHFNEIAWNQIDQIRKTAHTITRDKQQFAAINKNRVYLTRKEFDHLEPDFKQLDDQIRIFRDVVLSPTKIDITDSKEALIAYLTSFQNKLAVDKVVEPLA